MSAAFPRASDHKTVEIQLLPTQFTAAVFPLFFILMKDEIDLTSYYISRSVSLYLSVLAAKK